MKARSKELLDHAIAAMVAAIDVYNKPDFPYREESFVILAINGWELLLKAKWLAMHGNNIRKLYDYELRTRRDGSKGKQKKLKTTRSGNPRTHSIDFLGKKLVEQNTLNRTAWANIQALLEMRDSVVHFYRCCSPQFAERLQEVGAASLKNFVTATQDWFNFDLSKFNFYIMPLSFVGFPEKAKAVVLNREEKNFLNFLQSLEPEEDDPTGRYSVTVNVELRFTRSKAKDALEVHVTNNPNALPVRLEEEQIRERYPWDYKKLTEECKQRYVDFKVDQKYHKLRQQLENDKRYVHIRHLDPVNPKSPRKKFFNPNILAELDKQFTKKK